MTSPCQAAKAKQVPLSKFELNTNLPYEKLNTKLQVVRNRLNRPLTLSEKVLYSHLADPETQVYFKLNKKYYLIVVHGDRCSLSEAIMAFKIYQAVNRLIR